MIYLTLFKCPFARCVINIDSQNEKRIKSVLDLIRFINSTALNIENCPLSIQEATLSTYKLSE
jgi:hypothetical protein